MVPSYPSKRSEWASLDWQEAQHEVAKLLNRHGFMIFEEKSFPNHKRSDVVVIKQATDKTIFGIIEVKCYQKITRSLERKAMRQGLKYLNALVKISHDNARWGNNTKHYFVAVVYTNDYPASFNHHSIARYKSLIPSQLQDTKFLTLLATTPNSLISNLQRLVPNMYKQGRIDDYIT